MSLVIELVKSWVRTPVAAALGWTLVHSLWEGAIIAAVLALLLFAFPSPRLRYAAGCAGLALMLASFGVTLWHLWPDNRGLGAAIRFQLPPSAPLTAANTSTASLSLSEALALIAPWLAPLWMAGVLLFSVRSAVGWLRLSGLRRRGVCAAPPRWQQELTHLASEFRVSKPVLLLESALADTPMVLGHLRPVILVPLGFLAGLPPEQVEAILLHELAHIRRADYLVNTFQRLMDGLFFYHPAAWFISRVIRTERENCCDDAVVALLGDSHAYAEALAALEQSRVQKSWQSRETAMAAAGGSLITRVHRLLYPRDPANLWAPAVVATLLITTAAFTLVAWQASTSSAEQDSWSKWLNEDVVYIIEPQEKAAFQALISDEERQHFVEQFWERRNPTPGAAINPYKEEHYRRISYANSHWATAQPGWRTDRGRIYIQFGPPDEIDSHPSADSTHTSPYETWGYRYFKGFVDTARQTYVRGDEVQFAFVYQQSSKDYNLEGAQSIVADRASEADLPPAGTPPQSSSPRQSSWTKWLNEDVIYIIDPREKAAFGRLQSDTERQHFVEQFWERRNQTLGSATNAFKEEHYRRIAYSNRWSNGKRGWQTARGRIYILFGPPDEVDSHPKGDDSVGFPHEEWRYNHIVGSDPRLPDPKGKYGVATFFFVDRTRNGDFELDKAMLPAAPPK